MSAIEQRILELESKIIKSSNIKEIKKLEKKLDNLNMLCKMLNYDMVEMEYLICN